MPWETPFELSPDVPAEPRQGDAAGSRQDASLEAGAGFSFEDFFAERPAEPALPEPEPAPPAAAAQQPPAAPAQQQGGEEDEDLESFQAWLQSLKR